LLENIVSHNRYIIEEKKCEEGTVNRDGLIERKKERKKEKEGMFKFLKFGIIAKLRKNCIELSICLGLGILIQVVFLVVVGVFMSCFRTSTINIFF